MISGSIGTPLWAILITHQKQFKKIQGILNRQTGCKVKITVQATADNQSDQVLGKASATTGEI